MMQRKRSLENKGKALAVHLAHAKKAKKVKIIEPKVDKSMKKIISKPPSPLSQIIPRTRATTSASVKLLVRIGVANILESIIPNLVMMS